MTYTSHGHHIPGTILDALPPETRGRCGGVSLCAICSKEAAAFQARGEVPQEPTTMTWKDKQDAIMTLANELSGLSFQMKLHLQNTDQMMLISIKLQSAQQRLDALINMGLSNGE